MSPSAFPVQWPGILQKELSNEKRAPGCLGYSGGWNTTHLFMGIISYTQENKDLYMKKTHQDSIRTVFRPFFWCLSGRKLPVLPGRGGSEVDGLEERVLQTNPILESFGNAMTTRTGMFEIQMRCWRDVRNQRKRLEQTNQNSSVFVFFSSDLAGFRCIRGKMSNEKIL